MTPKHRYRLVCEIASMISIFPRRARLLTRREAAQRNRQLATTDCQWQPVKPR